MLVGVSANSYNGERTITSVTFTPTGESAISFSEVGTIENEPGRLSAIYSLLAPPSDTEGTVTITFDGSVAYGIIAGVANFSGVDQTDPLDGFVSAVGTEADAINVDVPSNEGDVVFDNIFIGAATIPTLTAEASQSEHWSTSINRAGGAASTESSSGGTTSMGWTASGGASTYYWAIGAVPINPAAAAEPIVVASATPSNETPTVGDSIDVTINIDMSGMLPPDDYLGAFTSSLTWNPAVLSYVSNSGLLAEYTGAINPFSDHINFNGTKTSGDTGSIDVFTVTFDVVGDADAELDLSFSVMASDGDNDILAFLTVNQGFVVAEPFTATVAVDGDVSSGTGNTDSSLSFEHTTGTGSNRLMLVGVSWNSGSNERDIDSVEFSYGAGPTILELIEVIDAQASGSPRNSAIYKINEEPPSGQTGTVTVTFTDSVSNGIVAGAVNFEGVDQATPLGSPASATEASSDSASLTLTGLDGDELVFDNLFQGASGETQIITVGADQTELWNAWVGNARGGSSIEPASSSTVTMTWTAASSSVYVLTAVPINPAPAVSPDHTVTFDANGGTGSMSPQVANEPTALTTNTFTRLGYTFDGWDTAPSGGGDAYADGATYDFLADITLYAQWLALPSYTVTFDANGGTGSMSPQSANVPTALTANTFTRTGYTFAGWDTVSGGGGTAYADEATYDFAADVTLYAQWTDLPLYTVTFDANGGTGSMSPQSANVPTALTANTFTRTGYTFAGWDTVSGGGGTAYADEATYDFAADVTLYAQWTDLPLYTVTFDANGGTGSMSPQSANVPTALTANTFTRTGYTFAGWNTVSGGGGTAYADEATYDFGADVTLYAQWDALPNHTVIFDANGGTGSMSPQIANLPTALTTNSFTRTGYIFDEWNTVAAGGGSVYADGALYSFAADVTLYAQWEAVIPESVVATATPSDETPDVGDSITVTINIDMTNMDPPDDLLGSFTSSLTWNPAILSYDSDSGLLAGFTGAINAGSGYINFNGAKATGVGGSIDVFTVTFNVVGAGDAVLNLGFSAMASDEGNSILSDLTINQGSVVAEGTAGTVVLVSSSNGSGTDSDTLAFAHSTGTGPNRLLLVGISWNSGDAAENIESVVFRYDSTDLALEEVITEQVDASGTATGPRFTAIYSLLNPPSGQAGTIIITLDDAVSNGIVAGAATFSGVNPAVPLGTPLGAHATETSTPGPTLTFSNLSGNELVFDNVFLGGNDDSYDLTVGADQTQLWNDFDTNARGAASIEQAASPVTMSWTQTNTANWWAQVGVPINPALGGVTYYDLTVAVNPTGAGTTNPVVGIHTYTENDVVDITASPASGFIFDEWSGDCSGSGACQVTMTGNKSVTANFNPITLPITFTGKELLGRPTDDSISIKIVPDEAITYYYEYGTTSGVYGTQTSNTAATAGEPSTVVITGLAANTEYFYRMQYSTDGGSTWIARPELSFNTQRAEGSTFTFDITTDSHVNILLGNESTWINTLNGVANDEPDFMIDLGDTFAMDDVNEGEVAEAEAAYEFQLQFFNIISGNTAVFLAPGNHEQQEAWHLDGTADSISVLGTNAEKKYFLNPVPDGSFYTGDEATYPHLSDDQLKQDYYAFEWGDALFVVINPYWYTTTKPYISDLGGGEDAWTGSGDAWDWTLGQTQFEWLRSTLESSTATYKFVFSHQMVSDASLSGQEDYGHAGANQANLVEWGGYNEDGSTYGWDTERAGWGSDPIHEILVANGVSAFFHGHDHQYAYEVRDGVVYQAVPAAGFSGSGFDMYSESDPYTEKVLDSSGHLKVTVNPEETCVDYIQTGGTTSAYTYCMEPPEEMFTLTIDADPSGGGTTNPSVGSHTYAEDTLVPIAATPATGYEFDHWSGACTGEGACELTMDADMSVTAHFVPLQFDLTISVDPASSGTTNPAAGTHTYDYGTVVDVIPTAATGYEFTYWSGDCDGTGACQVTITDDMNVIAHFTQTAFNLTIIIDPAESGTTIPSAGVHPYIEDSEVAILAAPATGYEFDHWSGDCTGTGTCSLIMDSNKTVTVHFSQIMFDLTINNDPEVGGTTDPAAGVHSYAYGSVVPITATPAENYNFVEWTGDCTGSGACEIEMYDDMEVTAHYLFVTHDLEIDLEPAGSGTTSPTAGIHTYDHGSVVDIVPTPAPGYEFAYWSGDCTGTGACQVTVDDDLYVMAHFAQGTYELTINVEPEVGGTTNPVPGVYEYLEGTPIVVIAEPASGFIFDHWSGDCSGSVTCAFEMDSNKTVTAHFSEPKACYPLILSFTGYGLDLIADPPNSEGCGVGTYEEGEAINLTATPDEGWHVAAWVGTADDGSKGEDNLIIMPDGEADVMVKYETYLFIPMVIGGK
ncbi:InlB B-repeat-containing protein [bacterium]|nr:InlB B-repeat-containing protein [bacterium]